MNTSQQTAIRLHHPADLIAAVPALLGFHPINSLVLVTLGGVDLSRLGVTVRVDLPDRKHERILVDQVVSSILQQQPTGVVVIVVGGVTNGIDLPHQRLVDRIDTAFAEKKVAVVHAVWTETTQQDAAWSCYHELDCGGRTPDPASTELAAANALAGVVTFPNREALVALCAPDDDTVLRRRSALLDRMVEKLDNTSISFTGQLALLKSEIFAAERGELPRGDERIVELAFALSDYHVRDACLHYANGPLSAAAEHLWLTLMRSAPAPECAEPAVLLGCFAYLRGDGVLASIALNHAEQALPGHRFAGLLSAALESGMSPTRLRELIDNALSEIPGVLNN